jgi:hypothetical protein
MWFEILRADIIDSVEVLHVADMHVDAANVVKRSARSFDRGFQVLANLPGLFGDIANAGNAAVEASGRHSGQEHKATGLVKEKCPGTTALPWNSSAIPNETGSSTRSCRIR